MTFHVRMTRAEYAEAEQVGHAIGKDVHTVVRKALRQFARDIGRVVPPDDLPTTTRVNSDVWRFEIPQHLADLVTGGRQLRGVIVYAVRRTLAKGHADVEWPQNMTPLPDGRVKYEVPDGRVVLEEHKAV